MRKLVATLACRNNGSRLYGKPSQNIDVEGGVTILQHLVSLLKTIPCIDEIVLGISEGEDNKSFIEYAEKNNMKYIVGHGRDVLGRLIACGDKADATDIFRVTPDQPFPYFEKIDEAWKIHLEGEYDATFMDDVPAGVNFEIVKLSALRESHEDGEDRHRSELCTLYIRENKNKFFIKKVPFPKEFLRKDIRLTVDHPEDLILCRFVYKEFKHLAPRIPLSKIIEFLDSRPDLKKLVYPFLPEVYAKLYK